MDYDESVEERRETYVSSYDVLEEDETLDGLNAILNYIAGEGSQEHHLPNEAPDETPHSDTVSQFKRRLNVLRRMPFLMQPSHFSGLGTGTVSSWLGVEPRPSTW